jgi:Tfp pilus assembly protein PilF
LAIDLPKAQRALQTALAHDPTHAAALRNLAHVLARRGHLVDAAVLVRRANGNSRARAESK